MSLNLTIKGDAKIVKIYNVTRLDIEGLDLNSYDLEVKEDVKELFEIVNDFVETGEADVYDMHSEIHGLDPESCRFKLYDTTQKEFVLDEAVLKNITPQELLKDVQNAQIGEIFYIKSFEGEALWDFDSDIEEKDIDPSNFEIGYIDCSYDMDQYDVFKEGVYDLICDTVNTDYIRYKKEKFELVDFVFHPNHIFGQLYIVKEDPIAQTKVLQKVEFGGVRLAGTDLDISDIENN